MSDRIDTGPAPTELRFNKETKTLHVTFEDGASFALPAEFLRVESPSAEVQGHGPGQKTVVSGRRHVSIMGIEPVGNYAVRLKFDDMHDTGIFSWPILYNYGLNYQAIWDDYLAALDEQGLSRDP